MSDIITPVHIADEIAAGVKAVDPMALKIMRVQAWSTPGTRFFPSLEGPAPRLHAGLAKCIQARGYDLQFIDHTPEGSDPEADWRGQANHTEAVVYVADDLDELEQCRIMAHELAHTIMHSGVIVSALPIEQFVRHAEVEAESFAYAVLRNCGYDASANVFPYIWLHGNGKIVPPANADCIRLGLMIGAVLQKETA